MLQTILDYKVLEDFNASKPTGNIIEYDSEWDRWIRFLRFLKSGTDLVISNLNESNKSLFVTGLTSGRGESKLSYIEKLDAFYKNQIPDKYGIHETFFLNEPDESNQQKYRSKNPHVFGFISDYLEAYERLALCNKKAILPVRINKESNQFESWDLLGNYLLPFSDCIIIDSYLFSETKEIWDQNLRKMLVQLDKSTPVKFNILIITYKGNKGEIKISDISEYLNQLKAKLSLKANISVIVTSKVEHDRYIFMNYMRIKSGTGINLFNRKEEPMVNTEIEFQTYENPENFDNADIILRDVSMKVGEITKKNSPTELWGDCKNKLLIYS